MMGRTELIAGKTGSCCRGSRNHQRLLARPAASCHWRDRDGCARYGEEGQWLASRNGDGCRRREGLKRLASCALGPWLARCASGDG
ncbi:uncharacterized protein B0I36DRAFT_327316 [Microdochium trichocladiopsis]|uniref:Uncharacterized protein n=1 Tax=Microdochium trichocladiopsis TaxID=1682393 RepID=A0A9P9BKZ6_9PEZI|nr:uncharacterized protein B0I36DRAFT_327316 [Microdochium trichocladiopsis]KAH7027547.1 hypothetical protein B0I36DRAFT_327316 [Microdochium trichocladiopsis]